MKTLNQCTVVSGCPGVRNSKKKTGKKERKISFVIWLAPQPREEDDDCKVRNESWSLRTCGGGGGSSGVLDRPADQLG